MQNTGKPSQEIFSTHWLKKGAYVYRMTDQAEVMGASKGHVSVKASPSDFIVTHEGVTFFAEVKSSQSKTSFPFKNIQDSQWSACRRVIANRGLYFFFLHAISLKLWFKVPANEIVVRNKIESSVKWNEIGEYICNM